MARGERGVFDEAYRQPAPESDLVTSERGVKLVEFALVLTMVIALGLFVAAVAVLVGT